MSELESLRRENEKLRAIIRAQVGFLVEYESNADRARALADVAIEATETETEEVRAPGMYERDTLPVLDSEFPEVVEEPLQ